MRIGLDYTAAVRQSAGIGRYVRDLAGALAEQLAEQEQLRLWAACRRPAQLPAALSNNPRVTLARIPVDDRWVTAGWQRLRLPVPLERIVGPLDVVHGPDFTVPPTSAPSVVTIHDLSYLIVSQFAHPRLRRYLTGIVPRTLRRAARVVAVSEQTRRDVLRYYNLPPEQVVAIPNGVDERFRSPDPEDVARLRDRVALPGPYVLTVGTIEPRKNHETVLRAFERVHAAHPELSLVIAGRPGWLSAPILDAIDEAARRLPVRHLTTVGDNDLPALYAGSVATVYVSWYEGFGLPVLEAMASGTAVIVSDRGALPEIAGDAALVVAAEDDEALATAISGITDNPDERAHRVQRGQEWSSRFTWAATAAAHLALYREIGRNRA